MKKFFVLTLLAAISLQVQADLKVRYTFANSDGTNVNDDSGNGYTATLKSNATIINMGRYNVLDLGSDNGYLDLGTSIGETLRKCSNFTISTYYYVNSSADISGSRFLWTFATSGACTATTGNYITYMLNLQKATASTGGYNNTTNIEIGDETAKGNWIHVAYRQTGTTGELFVNGIKVKSGTMTENYVTFSTAPTFNFLGRSPFNGDNYLENTYIYDFRIYDEALSDNDIAIATNTAYDLDYELNFNSRAGNFFTLKTQISRINKLLANSDSYSKMAVTEATDMLNIAQAIYDDGTASQLLISKLVADMKTMYDNLKNSTTAADSLYGIETTYNSERGFKHPGLLHTDADFERIKQQLADGDSITTAGWQMLLDNGYSSSDAFIAAPEAIYRGGNYTQNYPQASRAAAVAYQNALRWKISGDEAFAKNAVKQLNEWASTLKFVGGDTNQALAFGLTGYQFANAAELMRDYEGWEAAEFETFQKWMIDLWYPGNIGFLRGRFGTWENGNNNTGPCPGHYWSNWGLCNVLSAMSIGILCDDPFIYNQAVSFYKYDHVGTFSNDATTPKRNNGCNEFIGNLVINPVDDARGPFGKLSQMQETGRDQGHAQLALGLAVDVCQTALNQGDDLFAYMDNRLASGIEWQMLYNTADSLEYSTLPWTEYWYHDCRHADGQWKMTEPSNASQGTIRTIVERILGYYEGTMGIEMPWTEKAREKVGAEGGGGGSTSGGYDHLGFTTLTSHKDKINKSMAPTVLKAQMAYNGETYDQAEAGGLKATYEETLDNLLPKGTQITLMPSVADGSEDTGKWKWNTGETAQQITITADESRVYKVEYTNAAGVVSTQLFSIAVEGDCRADSIAQTVTYNNVVSADSTITIYRGDRVKLDGTASSAAGFYLWNNSQATTEIEAKYVADERDYTLRHTNLGGANATTNFKVKVMDMTPMIRLADGTIEAIDTVYVFKGDTIALLPRTSEAYSVGQWTWSNDSTSKNLVIEGVKESGTYTVTHTLNGNTSSLIFSVFCVSTEFGPAEGDYYIKNVETGAYLTNTGLLSPSFKDYTADDSTAAQQWNLTIDGDRYKITSLYDSKILTDYARLTSSEYNADKYSYYIYGVEGSDCYAIQNSSDGGSLFWIISSTGKGITGKGSNTMAGFPFQLVPVTATGINNIQTVQGNSSIYDLSGRKINALQKGVNIVKTKNEDGTVSIKKILTH